MQALVSPFSTLIIQSFIHSFITIHLGCTVNLEILAAKIFSVSRIIDIFADINFSDLVVSNFSSNSIIIVMVGSSLLAVLRICLFYFLISSRGIDASPTGRSGELSLFVVSQRTIDMTAATP